MINKILEQIGLNKNEIKIYLELLKLWNSMVWNIVKKSWIPRATVYDTLERLLEKSLVIKGSKNWQKTYEAERPETLHYMLEKKKDEIKYLDSSLSKMMPELQSMANQFSIVPSIKFYEWLDWVEKVLNDTLNAKEEVYTYVNTDWMDRYIFDLNEKYLKKRKELWIKKKWLLVKTPDTIKRLKWYDKSVSKARFLSKDCLFSLECEIYDWKVSFMTFSEEKIIAMIIENKEIYEMHRKLFEEYWKTAEIIN